MRPIAVTAPLFFGVLTIAISLGTSPRLAFAAADAGTPADSDAPTTIAAGQPMLEITKSCPKLRYLGRDAVFEITVTNRGDGPAHDVVVTDVTTGRIDFVSADHNGVREDNHIVWRLGTLEAGANRTLKATFRCNHIGNVQNAVTVTYCAEATDTCALAVKGIPAILLECVDDPDPIEINGSLTYTITVLNQGSAVGSNIVIACTLPPEQAHVSATGPTKAKVEGKKVTFASLASLAPQATAVYKVTVKGIAEGDARFRVQLTSDQVETPVTETESSHIYQ